jgi:hypothetical protein
MDLSIADEFIFIFSLNGREREIKWNKLGKINKLYVKKCGL